MIIGIDGGGTKTTGVAVDEDGKILAIKTVGPSNPNSSPEETVRHEIKELFSVLTKEKALTEEDVVFAGISGVESGGKKEWFIELLKEFAGPYAKIFVDNDAVTALYSETKGQPGIVCISGTGSIVYGINAMLERDRVGGWGYLIGDGYSGFALGKKTLDHIFSLYDQGESPGEMTDKILNQFKVETVPELVPVVYEMGKTRDRVAAIAKIVIELSCIGDEKAIGFLHEAADSMMKDITLLFHKLYGREGEHTQIPIVLTGGINQHSKEIITYLLEKGLKERSPFSFKLAAQHPVAGAIYAAHKAMGKDITPIFIKRLEAELTKWMKTDVKG
ncbi:ROK family protein [Sutcliffiella horikoshii]|uniref:ROK family protein n=1 Tax=Sutcliffiella horikoshii TaxID=79883 RepID=A0A5D4T0A3_9BACI|nr:BadF/BadG/BcrA/BcrD ATPase family protein [Sutcliffiella horikoshii]TYS67536.1 ROK family protein [Sutcliffiella horikoshii]